MKGNEKGKNINLYDGICHLYAIAIQSKDFGLSVQMAHILFPQAKRFLPIAPNGVMVYGDGLKRNLKKIWIGLS